MTRLTKRRLEAILEALNARLAGEYKDIEPKDYEAARNWAIEQLEARNTGREAMG